MPRVKAIQDIISMGPNVKAVMLSVGEEAEVSDQDASDFVRQHMAVVVDAPVDVAEAEPEDVAEAEAEPDAAPKPVRRRRLKKGQ